MKTFQEHYLNKDFNEALKVLEKNKSEIDLATWHYNMATLKAELNDWPVARFHILFAERLGMKSPSLDQNKLFIETKLDSARLEGPLNLSDYFITSAKVGIQGPLLTMSLLILIISLIWMKKTKKLTSAIMSIVLVVSPLLLNWWVVNWPWKIALEKKIIYDGPSTIFVTHSELPAGVVLITSKKGIWEKIIFPSRFSGWIKSDGLKSLEIK